MLPSGTFSTYTGQVLSFALGGARSAPLPPSEPDPAARKWAERLARAWSHRKQPHFLLLGLWQPCLAAALLRLLPDSVRLVVSDADPEAVRAAGGQPDAEILAHPRVALLCDTSAWAHRLLWDAAGLTPDSTFAAVNPLLPAEARGPCRELERLLGLSMVKIAGRCERPDEECLRRPGDNRAGQHDWTSPERRRPKGEGHDGPSQMIPPGPPRFSAWKSGHARPGLSVAAILHPAEPGLPEFFAAIPDWVAQVCVVWDASEPPDAKALGIAPDPRRVEAARLLAGDFAAQRNRMLGLCRGEWVLTLDGDERLPDSVWACLPALMARAHVSGIYFQRQTLYPDESSCKIGYGLWPDLQLRLFRNLPGLAYARPVHEILEGLPGPRAVLASGAIAHYSRLRKTPEELRRKLGIFDSAASGAFGHRLNAEYPHVPRALLPNRELEFPARLLMIP